MIVFASLEYGQQISHRLKRFINSIYFISHYIIFSAYFDNFTSFIALFV